VSSDVTLAPAIDDPLLTGRRKLRIDFVATLLGRGAAVLSNLVFLVWLTREYPPAIAAPFLVVSASVTIAAVIVRLGLGRMANREVAIALASGRRVEALSLAHAALVAQVILLLVGVPALVGFLRVGLRDDVATSVVPLLAGLWLVWEALRALGAEILRGQQRILAATLVGEGPRGVLTSIPVLVALLGGERMSMVDLIWWQIVPTIVLGVIAIAVTPGLPRRLLRRVNHRHLAIAFSGALWIGLAELGTVWIYQSGTLLAGLLLDDAATSRVALLLRVALFFNVPLVVVNSAMAPRIARAFAEDRLPRLEPVLRKAALACLVAGAALAAVLLVVLPLIVREVPGFSVADLAAALVLVCAGQLVALWCGSCGVALLMTNGLRDVVTVTVGAAIAFTVCGVLLAWAAGVMGLLTALAATIAVSNLVLERSVRTRLGITTRAGTGRRHHALAPVGGV
jgi:O-antigen/teichoic acid export membrane protein